MNTNTNFNLDASIAQIIEKQQELDALKTEQQQAVLAHIYKLVCMFNFTQEDIFGGASQTRTGVINKCRKLIASNPTISRKDFMAWAKENGVSENTASTQFHKIRKKLGAEPTSDLDTPNNG